jgi:hypothetical protein
MQSPQKNISNLQKAVQSKGSHNLHRKKEKNLATPVANTFAYQPGHDTEFPQSKSLVLSSESMGVTD